MTDITEIGMRARAASHVLAMLSTEEKNAALRAIADALEAQAGRVLEANAKDLETGRERGLSDALLDRLMLNEARIGALAADTRKVVALPDPVGTDLESRVLPNGLRVTRRRIPLGVIGVIYEARPNVTIDIATLCLKTGNAAILRGGSETIHSNTALARVIQEALAGTPVPAEAVQYLENPDRELVGQLLRLDQYVDVIIPRGGASLHRRCKEQSTIPVITGGVGICHAFIDATANLDQAVDIVENGKTHRPSVCNSLDTVLVYRPVADAFLPRMAERLARRGVEFRATSDAREILEKAGYASTPAGPDDFDTEWMSLVLGVKIVDSLEEAIDHIRAHSMDHSDTIVTQDFNRANRFVQAINSSAVFVNASTRFNDGGQFGLGAEVAVSTQKLHARGPMGLEELTTYKWIGIGDGHVRK